MSIKLDVNKLILSDHAYERAIERLNLKVVDVKQVTNNVRNLIKNSKFITETTAKDGNRCYMFASKGIAYFIDKGLRTVVTINKFESMPHNPIHSKAKELYQKEIRKLDRSERARMKQLELLKLESNYEIAELMLKMHKTKSESVKLACKGRQEALKMRVDELHKEVKDIQDKKRQIANAMTLFM